jgi:hypothetical protein
LRLLYCAWISGDSTAGALNGATGAAEAGAKAITDRRSAGARYIALMKRSFDYWEAPANEQGGEWFRPLSSKRMPA